MRIEIDFASCEGGRLYGDGALTINAYNISRCAVVLIAERNELRLVPGESLRVGDTVDCHVSLPAGTRQRSRLYFGTVIHVFESKPMPRAVLGSGKPTQEGDPS